MATKNNNSLKPKVSNEKVIASTGKNWNEWFKILSKFGTGKKSHKEIALWIKNKFKISPWWSQMITTSYEQKKGVRKINEKPDGFEINVAKTLNSTIDILYEHFLDPLLIRKWLKEKQYSVRKATANKSMRITWIDEITHVQLNFCQKGTDKSQVTVQHGKLPNSTAANKMKRYWTLKLKTLDKIINKENRREK
jgi:hypothetical protein